MSGNSFLTSHPWVSEQLGQRTIGSAGIPVPDVLSMGQWTMSLSSHADSAIFIVRCVCVSACSSSRCCWSPGEYIRAFRQKPTDPLLSLLLAIQYIHLACQKFPRSRHSCIIQVSTTLHTLVKFIRWMNNRGTIDSFVLID